eukprot:764123-Hanusia_phi.AAC.1
MLVGAGGDGSRAGRHRTLTPVSYKVQSSRGQRREISFFFPGPDKLRVEGRSSSIYNKRQTERALHARHNTESQQDRRQGLEEVTWTIATSPQLQSLFSAEPPSPTDLVIHSSTWLSFLRSISPSYTPLGFEHQLAAPWCFPMEDHRVR